MAGPAAAGGGAGFGGASGPGGVSPGSGAGGGAGGGYTPNPRGPTSRYELKIDWRFPSYVDASASADGKTSAVQARRALALADAYEHVAGEDRRPLLVLRECLTCNGTDDALMTRNADNERTLLMSRWFHCVKLPPDVIEEDHPFHALFAGDDPGHLFFARWDGSGRRDLNGQQSRTELWSLMESYLSSEYERGADGSLKAMLSLLDRFDRIDADIAETEDEMEEAIARGVGASKLEKLQDRLAELDAAKTRARADAVKLSDLKLKLQQKPTVAGGG